MKMEEEEKEEKSRVWQKRLMVRESESCQI